MQPADPDPLKVRSVCRIKSGSPHRNGSRFDIRCTFAIVVFESSASILNRSFTGPRIFVHVSDSPFHLNIVSMFE